MNSLILLTIIFATSFRNCKTQKFTQFRSAALRDETIFPEIACKLVDAGLPINWLPGNFDDEFLCNLYGIEFCKKNNLSGENKKLIECEFCIAYYRKVNFNSKISFDELVEICKQNGCYRLKPKVTNDKALLKFKDHEHKVIKYCEKHTNYNYCREKEDGQCNQYDLKTKSYTETRDFKIGDTVIVLDLPRHLEGENVFKKKIYKSKKKFYTSCGFPGCFNEQESDKDYCKYHDNGPFVSLISN